MQSVFLHHKTYPWMEFLKTNEVGMGGGEDVLSLACFLISTSILCIDLNLVVGIFFSFLTSTFQFIFLFINKEALIGQKGNSKELKISRKKYDLVNRFF